MSDPPFTVKALFEYTSEHEDDLHFQLGQVITVTAEEDADWYYGEYVDDSGSKREGIFPRNFVERFEPTAPPRPNRPVKARKEAEPVPTPSQPIVEAPVSTETSGNEPPHEDKPSPVVASEPRQEKELPLPPAPAPAPAPAVEPNPPSAASQPPKQQSDSPPASVTKAPPPAVSSKPSSNAFKDRIAAFNKPAAPPIAPFKPGGPGSTSNSFIKKPFVAPPPSKNAYVPIPREQPPPKLYRREEDPEFANREPPVSERSQPLPAAEPSEDDDQPKPTTLKERIALLQKQQLEQASRLAEAAQKKEKAKKPPKKRTDLQEAPAIPSSAAESTELEQTEAVETPRNERPSMEGEIREEFRPPQLASPPPPSRELLSDTNDADYSGAADTEDAEETSTSREDYDERPPAENIPGRQRPAANSDKEEEEPEEEEANEEEEQDEDVDPEVKRRMELRERMAKMSGGMGMMGMFGGGMPGMYGGSKKAKAAVDTGGKREEESESAVPPAHAPPIPIMALPGMNAPKPQPVTSPKEVSKEDEHGNTPLTQLHSPEEVPDIEDVTEESDTAPRKSLDRAHPPPPPLQERSIPPMPAVESRPPPPPVPVTQPGPPPPVPESRPLPPAPQAPMSPSSGSESDDEISVRTRNMSLNTAVEAPSAPPRRASTFDSPRSPTISEKRFSRGPPPIPTSPPHGLASPPQARPPPPPPPGTLSRQGTLDTRHGFVPPEDDIQDETTEYEADYDTDMAPSAKFKDALKSHDRESSIDDGGDERSPQSPRVPPESRPPPPLPPTAPRAIPPPPPPSQPPNKRASMDVPRSAPPPPPPPHRELTAEDEDNNDDDYDPYRYDTGRPHLPPLPPKFPPPRQDYDDHDDDDEDDDVSQVHAPPPLPPSERPVAPPPPPPASEAPRARQSIDVSRSLMNTRRSMDIARPSLDMGFIATDVDLAENTFWWTQPNTPPPIFQNRKDLLYEVEESTSSKRGGKTTVTKDVYVLFADYSQTVINVRFDAKNPSDVSFEQRHEPPPSKLRQDQLETAHEQYGSRISAAASTIQNTTVGDGTAHGLVQHLLGPLGDVLLPVGTRAYGALVYANLANASVQQNDEIRAGDIISFRNARFQGHRGGLHQKYSAEVGKPDHVGVIIDWDGTKKKIHAWEQGRESKKVKAESFKLGDLKSGEVKVWRVMPRSWVGWE